MRCTKCGAEIADNEKFCSKCGAPVAWSADSKTSSADKADKAKNSEKQNSNFDTAKLNDDTLGGDTTETQNSGIIVSDVTIEDYGIIPESTISEDDVMDYDNKKKAKSPDKIEKKKSDKESKPDKNKKKDDDTLDFDDGDTVEVISTVEVLPDDTTVDDGKPEVKKEKSVKDKKEDKKDKKSKKDKGSKEEESDVKAKDADAKDEKVEDNAQSESDDKAEEEPSPVKVEEIKIVKSSEPSIEGSTIDESNIKDSKVIKINKDTEDIKLTVTETTTVSEELVHSDNSANDYEVKMPENNESKQISVAGKNLTFVEGNKFSLARDDKLLSPGARANIERRKAEAAEALKKGKSDEERINEAVKAIKESVLRNGKEGWICRVCGHYNPSTTTSCLKCGRDRVRMAKLKARGYDPNAVPQLVKRKRRVRPKRERIIYLKSEKKEEVVQETGAPVVHNFIYTGAQQKVVLANDPYVTVDHPIRNRILASVCTLLMLLFICVSLFATAYIGVEGSTVKGYSGIEIILAVAAVIVGGERTGSKYFNLFQKEVTQNGWIINGTGLINQRTFAGLMVMLILLAVVGIAIADFVRCIMRISKGKAMKGKFHILSLIILVGVSWMFLFIWMHNTFAFYQEGSAAFWGHQATVTVELEGMTITDVVYGTGIAYILTFFFILARFIIGFFFAKPERMKLSEASEKYPNVYPQKYYDEHPEISPEEYNSIMVNAGANQPMIPPNPPEPMTVQRTTTETVSTFDQPISFAPTPPPPPISHKDVKTQTFTTYAVEGEKPPVVTEYKVTKTETVTNDVSKTTDSTITEDLDSNSREKSKKEGN